MNSSNNNFKDLLQSSTPEDPDPRDPLHRTMLSDVFSETDVANKDDHSPEAAQKSDALRPLKQ